MSDQAGNNGIEERWRRMMEKNEEAKAGVMTEKNNDLGRCHVLSWWQQQSRV
jgi:hypothetical protein